MISCLQGLHKSGGCATCSLLLLMLRCSHVYVLFRTSCQGMAWVMVVDSLPRVPGELSMLPQGPAGSKHDVLCGTISCAAPTDLIVPNTCADMPTLNSSSSVRNDMTRYANLGMNHVHPSIP